MKLEFMIKDAARRKCYKRRVESMKKKLAELCTLCDVEACAIIKSPDEAEPVVWPNSMDDVKKTLTRFMKLPIYRRMKHMVSLEGYIKDMIKKAERDLKKQINKNEEKQMKEVVYQCLRDDSVLAKFDMKSLDELGSFVDQNLADIESRIESLKKASSVPADQAHMVASCSNTSNQVMALEKGKQPMVGDPGIDDEMNSTKSFMDLLMGSDTSTSD